MVAERERNSGVLWRSTLEATMTLQLCCTCGYTFRAEDEDELWEKGQAHIKEAHPDMVGMVRRDDILAQAELV